MHPVLSLLVGFLHRAMPRVSAASLVGVALLSGCRTKATGSQCDTLIAHYAEAVVREQMPSATTEVIRAEQERVREQAKGDEGFKNCTTEVELAEFECAMAATSPGAIEKCLE